MVDSIHESGSGTRDIPPAIGTLEDGWRNIESRGRGVRGRRGGGLRFAHHRRGTQAATRGVRAGKARSAAGHRGSSPGPEPHSARSHARWIQPDVGTAHSRDPPVPTRQPVHRHARRTRSSSTTGGRLRCCCGETRACAANRRCTSAWTSWSRPTSTAALKVTGDDRETRHAVGRQADCLLEPFMRRVWVQAGDDKAHRPPGPGGMARPPVRPRTGRTSTSTPRGSAPSTTCSAGGRVRGRGAGRRDGQPP